MAELKYDRAGLIPAIVQDTYNGRVLMLAYMNKEALENIETGQAWFYSRSRQELWHKGATSAISNCRTFTLIVTAMRWYCRLNKRAMPAIPGPSLVFTALWLHGKTCHRLIF